MATERTWTSLLHHIITQIRTNLNYLLLTFIIDVYLKSCCVILSSRTLQVMSSVSVVQCPQRTLQVMSSLSLVQCPQRTLQVMSTVSIVWCPPRASFALSINGHLRTPLNSMNLRHTTFETYNKNI